MSKYKKNTLTEEEKDFIYFAEMGNLKKVKEYIAQGINVNAKDTYGITALHKAAKNGYLDIVRLLVESGAEVDCLDDGKFTPLMNACFSGQIDTVDYLLSKGAQITGSLLMEIQLKVNILKENAALGIVNPDAVDTWTWFLKYLQLAQMRQLKPITDKNSQVDAQLINAAFKGNLDDLKLAIEGGANVNACDQQEISALRWAAHCGHINIVEALLDAGADINKTNSYGRNALLEAVFAQNFDIVKLLIDRGSDVNAKTSNNSSILFFAKELLSFTDNTENTKKIIDILEKNGAILSYPND